MRIINGQKYLTTGDLGAYVNRSPATIVKWCKYSDILEEKGEERLIPKPHVIKGHRLFTTEQASEIKKFASNMRYGTMANFNRKKLGKRGVEIEQRVRKREKERDNMREEIKVKELDGDLSKINKAVDFKNRFKRLKKDL